MTTEQKERQHLIADFDSEVPQLIVDGLHSITKAELTTKEISKKVVMYIMKKSGGHFNPIMVKKSVDMYLFDMYLYKLTHETEK